MQFRKASSLITQSIFPCYTNSYNIIPGTCGWKKLGSEIKINNFHSCSLTEGILLSFQGNNENILTFQNLFPTLFFFPLVFKFYFDFNDQPNASKDVETAAKLPRRAKSSMHSTPTETWYWCSPRCLQRIYSIMRLMFCVLFARNMIVINPCWNVEA